MSDNQRVVVTGLGLVTAIGCDESTVWANLLAGRTGIRKIRNFDLANNAVQIGAEIDTAAMDAALPPVMRRADRSLKFALEATRQALAQAGRLSAPGTEPVPQSVASVWGCGVGPADSLHQAGKRFAEKGPAGMRPSTVPNCMANMISAGISIQYQLTGSNYVIVSACTSSTNALGVAFRMIRHGYADAVLCGGVDTPFDPFYYAMWNNLGVFSTIAEPERALRPFAADRAGTVLGEGAGVLLLESLASVQRRGARIRGEVLGYGETSDATHITGPSATGQAAAIRAALTDAQIQAPEIGYINAHGTGTDANDSTETQAIRGAFGDGGPTPLVGATKSFFGHTLGASGTIEIIGTLLALENRIAPPNLNLDQPDPACKVSLVGREPAPLTTDIAIKNSFGFGGGNAVAVLRRWTS
jgi:3-oxoacyl-[acyl-carrier-protein] synthase II